MESEKRILVLDRHVVDKIDKYRGDLTRVEFIELCIDTSLEMEDSSPSSRSILDGPPIIPPSLASDDGSPATREEFDAFKKTVKELIRALLDFYITFGLDMAPGNDIENPEKLRNRLRSQLERL